MNYLKQAGLVTIGLVLGVMAVTTVMADRIDRAMISVNRIETISASQDSTAWALTTDGKVMHCRFNGERVTCHDRNGVAGSDY